MRRKQEQSVKPGEPISHLKPHLGVLDFFSLRTHGNMKAAAGETGRRNREAFRRKYLPFNARIITAGLVHGNAVAVVNDQSSDIIDSADALVTRETNLFLGITFADCFPVILLDAEARVAAAAHCGYKPTVGGIIRETVAQMVELGAKRKSIRTVIGPGICPNCFEFGPEAVKVFARYAQYLSSAPRRNGEESGRYLVDLRSIIVHQLLKEESIPREFVRISPECTKCQAKRLFSHRHDRKKNVEAGIALVGLTG